MGRVVGIDLGTTYSGVAYLRHGRPVIIPNAEGDRLTPSVVGFLKDGRRMVGQLARLQALANPEGTVFSIKRRMGQRASRGPDAPWDQREVVRQIKRSMGSGFSVNIGGREYSPEEISAMILHKVKTDAESYLGEAIDGAVISVPAYFNVSQRQATVDAGTIAGLRVMRIVDEPTAAALSYGLDVADVHTVLVWDLGGGTFDVSILELGEGLFEVKAVNGNTHLGGDDYDERIVGHLMGELYRDLGVDLRGNRAALLRLKEVAERAKIDLTTARIARIRVPFMDVGQGSLQHWETALTQEKFEELTADLRQQMILPTQQALADARLRPEDIDRVILVGGSTRMPGVQALARELLEQEPYTDINPDEAVALGAAIQAGILAGEIKGKLLVDVTPLSLGIETEGGLFTRIIERNTPVPVSKGHLFTNAADHQSTMDIHVLQGEREMAVNNMTLATFDLAGIPPAPRGEARVEVTFKIDANGTLRVTAHDLYSDTAEELRVSPRFYGLQPQELARMVKEAERFAAEDRRQREERETHIKANNMIRAASEALARSVEDAPMALRDEVEAGVLRVRASLAGADISETMTMTEELASRIRALSRAGRSFSFPLASRSC